MDFNQILNNNQNVYYGHGTGTDDNKVTESIMNNGLRCSHGSLYFTSVALGTGSEISKSKQELLRNWPHGDSKIIIIVSLPSKYNIIDTPGTPTYNKGNSAYYYIPSEIIRKKNGLTDSFYVMPEFIIGYYDSRTNSFIPNAKYYEKLSEQEQKKLFNKVKENYFNIISNSWGIEEYKDICKDLQFNFGLTEEDLKKFQNREFSKKEEMIGIDTLIQSINPTLKNKKYKLPNGIEISFKQYMTEYVVSYIDLTKNTITLNTGATISMKNFIEEGILSDCQRIFNGDLPKYIEEKVLKKDKIEKSDISKKDIESKEHSVKKGIDVDEKTKEVSKIYKEFVALYEEFIKKYQNYSDEITTEFESDKKKLRHKLRLLFINSNSILFKLNLYNQDCDKSLYFQTLCEFADKLEDGIILIKPNDVSMIIKNNLDREEVFRRLISIVNKKSNNNTESEIYINPSEISFIGEILEKFNIINALNFELEQYRNIDQEKLDLIISYCTSFLDDYADVLENLDENLKEEKIKVQQCLNKVNEICENYMEIKKRAFSI